jgi:hypothetical protein
MNCESAIILPVISGLFPDNANWRIVEVDVAVCQNGFAQVFAIPDQIGCPTESPHCRETEQIFLQLIDGTWTYLTAGTGIECPEPLIAAACVALGLP